MGGESVERKKKRGGRPCFCCFRATRCRDGLPCAWYHRGDWEIKAACLEEVWSGFTSSFGSLSDPSWVHFPNLYQDWKTFPWNIVISQKKRGREICLMGNLPTLIGMELEKSRRKRPLPPLNRDGPHSIWATAPPRGRSANTHNSFWAASNSWSHHVDPLQAFRMSSHLLQPWAQMKTGLLSARAGMLPSAFTKISSGSRPRRGGGSGAESGQHEGLMKAAKLSVVNRIHLRTSLMEINVPAEHVRSHRASSSVTCADHVCDQAIGLKLRPTLQSWEKTHSSL